MRWISEEISWLSIVGTNSINMVWKLHQLGQSLVQKLDYAGNRVAYYQEFITIRVCNCHIVSTTTIFAVWHGKQCGQHVHRLCKLCSNHNAATTSPLIVDIILQSRPWHIRLALKRALCIVVSTEHYLSTIQHLLIIFNHMLPDTWWGLGTNICPCCFSWHNISWRNVWRKWIPDAPLHLSGTWEWA